MPAEHIVLLEWKEGVREDRMLQALSLVAGLKSKVPGVNEVKGGKNFSDGAGKISYAIVVTLDDKDALAGYGPHPAHQEASEALGKLVEKQIVVDFET